jgi:phosphate/sulfate permease
MQSFTPLLLPASCLPSIFAPIRPQHLLVFLATLGSFAHGANDTANATGAFSAMWQAYDNG